MEHRAQGCLEHEDDPVTHDPEKTVGKLLKALRTADPSWSLSSVSSRENPFDPYSPEFKVWRLSQGTRTFCLGRGFSRLLLDLVECCRDRWYSTGPGWRIPGVLLDAADLDDLVFRLEVLT